MLYKTDIWDTVFNNYKDPICIVDRNFNILRINANLLKLIGSTEQNTLGNSCQDFLFNVLSHKHIQQIENVLVTKKRETIYLVVYGKYYELTVDPCLNDTGQLYAVVFVYNDISDHVKFEKILKQNETDGILKTLISNFPGIIYRCKNDKNWTMEFISDGCCELTGYANEALINNKKLSYNDLVLPEDQEKLWDDWQISLKKRIPYVGEYRIRTASGDIKWVWEQGCGVYSEDGKVEALEGIIIDVTERKLPEEMLRSNEKRFSLLFNYAAIPVWEEDFSLVKLYFDELSKKGITDFRKYFNEYPDEVKKCVSLITVTDVNDESIRFFKLFKKEQVDFNLQHYFLEESYEILKEEMIALAEGSTLFESEIPVTNFIGMKNYLLLRLVVVPGRENDLSQILVSFVDITEKNNAIQQLKDTEERMRILINNLSDFICFKDAAGRWHEVNQAGLKLFELEGVDYHGKKDSDLAFYSSFFKDVFSNCEASDELTWKSAKPTIVEETIPRQFGGPLIYQLKKIPTFDDAGNRKSLIVVGKDITPKNNIR
jgi:PAS domain S-box-containing protein